MIMLPLFSAVLLFVLALAVGRLGLGRFCFFCIVRDEELSLADVERFLVVREEAEDAEQLVLGVADGGACPVVKQEVD